MYKIIDRPHARANRTLLADSHDAAHYQVQRGGGLARYLALECRRAPEAWLLRLLLDRSRGNKLLCKLGILDELPKRADRSAR